MHSWTKWVSLAGAISVAGFFTWLTPTRADEVSDFYGGKTLTVSIGYGAGGGYDLYGRLVSRYIGDHIPGKPTVIAQNVPGAGSIKLANFLYSVAPKDGTALGVIGQATAIEQALGSKGIRYKAQKFNWIGRLTSNAELNYTWHTSPTKTIADALTRETILGGTGPSSASVAYPRLLKSLLGVKFRVIAGYKGSAEVNLAMERGEVEGAMASWASLKSSHPDWLRDNKIHILVQYGQVRHPELADVPTMVDLAKTEDQRHLMEFFASSSVVGRSVMTTADVPRPRVVALRIAFDDMIKDPEVLQEIKSRNIEFDPMPGTALQQVIEETLNVPPALIARAKTARKP